MSDSIDRLKSLMSQRDGIARSNLFRVKLPTLPGATMEELNVLCKDVTLPGRQILTSERKVGMKIEKIPYGFSNPDVSMTFHVLNDYGVKEYFETWQSLALDQDKYEIGYQRGPGGYGRRVQIEQLKKVEKVPSFLQQSNFKTGGIGQFFPRLQDIDIVKGFFELGEGMADIIVYKCQLENAYPTSMNAINLNNDLDGIVELNISLSYTDWKPISFISPTNIKQAVRGGIGTLVGSLFN